MRRCLYKAIFVGILILLMCPQPVYAYVDPGAGSLLLQLLLGGIAGVLVVGKLYWRRLKDFLGFKEKTAGPGSQETAHDSQE